METTRTFPRTAASAFKDASYADPIEPPPPKRRIADLVFGLCLAAIVIATFIVLAITKGPAP